jgi:hypothetical protein
MSLGTFLSCAFTWLLLAFMAISTSEQAWAHIGPPFPIVENRKIGDLTVSVWSNPDVGTGTFFVMIDPPKGASVPGDMKVQVIVQPVSGRLPEARYDAWREALRNRVEFKADVPFDKEETWRVRIQLASAQVKGETAVDVPVTPTLGRWSLLFFLLPFLGIAALWLRAIRVARRRRRKLLSQKANAGTKFGPPKKS